MPNSRPVPVGLLLPTLLLLVAGAAYGSILAANRIVGEAGFPVIPYMFWQAALGGVLVTAINLVRGARASWRPKHAGHYVVSATFGMLLPFGALSLVATELPTGVVTLVVTLVPALTYAMAFALRVEPFRAMSVAALLLGFVGVLMIVLPQGSLPDPAATIWILPALIAPLAASTNNVLVATLRPPDSDSLTLVGAVLLAATIIMFPIALVTNGLDAFWSSWTIAGGVIWAAAVQVVGYYALYEVIRRAGPVFFSQASYIIVLSGLAWALLLFGERPSPW
ncbi:MAG: DMT family transporter, partial [Alphaproteobacteria bacterium]|nr:DMT family transporter [Alphaproteobacteria bacterium]